ncbi:MAG: hypothetical protein Q8Q88_20300 [Phenylobacterium sp.]|uniref:DUF6772 family protein n=1 Tax=Phenylobacterium sp. TaxID=1871053 RepID=UPI0027327059|nr:DUF6772 family protein [Phenylobacterium sp.]MDP3749385.1 hypothetical protein [Phenylobacterium sp.]
MSRDSTNGLRRALLDADPGLSRFDPLPRILTYDDFDRGLCGWSQLIGNYEGDLDTMLPGYRPITSPMLSTLSHWDGGSHGGMDGSYVLKLATRPQRDALTVGIKRLTFRKAGPIRLEFYMTFKPEANALALSDQDLKAVGFLLDLQGGDKTGTERVMPHLRYLNADAQGLQQKWQFKPGAPRIHDIGDGEETVSHFHLEDDGWVDLPGGDQKLCYNEIATKVNWHYVCLDFDLATMKATGLRCNDRAFDLSGFDALRMPAMKNLWCMLNLAFFAETATDKRAFLYIDSVCLSGDF